MATTFDRGTTTDFLETETADGAGASASASRRNGSYLSVVKMAGPFMLVAGVFLYSYTLYIALSRLVYPTSVAPFFSPRTPPGDAADAGGVQGVVRCVLMDSILLSVFVTQHSLMAASSVKTLFHRAGLGAILRPFYVFCTCFAMQFIYHFWEPTPRHTLWSMSMEGGVVFYGMVLLHGLCWVSIACSVFFIDYLELVGIKQLFYAYYEMGDPIGIKAAEQQYLFLHMRHPIFIAPLLLLWAVPVMTFDRLMVAVMVPLYLGWGSSLDRWDVSYVRDQFKKKTEETLLANGKVN